MPCRPRPEAEEELPGGDTARRLRTIERWLQHAEEGSLHARCPGRGRVTPSMPATISRGGGGMGQPFQHVL